MSTAAMILNLPSGRHVEIYQVDDALMQDARDYRLTLDGNEIGRVWLDDVRIWRQSDNPAVGYETLMLAAWALILPAFERDAATYPGAS